LLRVSAAVTGSVPLLVKAEGLRLAVEDGTPRWVEPSAVKVEEAALVALRDRLAARRGSLGLGETGTAPEIDVTSSRPGWAASTERST